ncbi:hypothetical protein EMPG_11722 [Blastomyces silverae]|uniref:Uncharacterized protein n=1 Tax=Blastomyces silverae TaxID=2060906 RepID=A0A0H1BWB3_9EURO|nr:hypothetical protein EMPG_11722 [Blastomyces silverae]
MTSQAASFNESSINNMNAASTSKGPGGSESTIIEIAKDGDLVVEVIEYCSILKNRKRPRSLEPAKSALFQVSRYKLAEHSAVFNELLFGAGEEANRKRITLKECNITSMELWFRIMHANISSIHLEKISIIEMWHAVLACDKYAIERDEIEPWFRMWWEALSRKPLSNTDLCRMLLPCYYFRCWQGFMFWTKKLVYESMDAILNTNPIRTAHTCLRLPIDIIKTLNITRRQIRNIIHDRLCSPIDKLAFSVNCKGQERVFDYIIELDRLDASPLLPTFRRKSIRVILQRLEGFKETPGKACIVHPTCAHYRYEFGTTVKDACVAANNHFGGLDLSDWE